MNEQHISKVILKIYADFKWKLKIADRTPEDVNRLIDEAIAEVQAKVPASKHQSDAIQKFEQMKNRFSEHFDAVPTVELGKPNPCKCGGSPKMILRKMGDNPTLNGYEIIQQYICRCQKCGKESIPSETPFIALENWNNGMVD